MLVVVVVAAAAAALSNEAIAPATQQTTTVTCLQGTHAHSGRRTHRDAAELTAASHDHVGVAAVGTTGKKMKNQTQNRRDGSDGHKSEQRTDEDE